MDINDKIRLQIEEILEKKETRSLPAKRFDMDNAIRIHVIPFLRQRGFKGSYPNLYRLQQNMVHAITFQFSCYGGRFIIVLLKGPQNDKISPHKLREANIYSIGGVSHRLGFLSHSGNDYWYKYDNKPDNQNNYLSVAEEVISDYEKYAEEWFNLGRGWGTV